MTFGNAFRDKIQKLSGNFIDMFSVKKKTTDEHLECIQFGICDYSPKQVKEIPYFHF